MSEIFLTRHSKASYDEYDKVLQGENPQESFDHHKQDHIDLTTEGIKLAQEKAREFLQKLDPKTDSLFFVMSNEARAIGTADIYRQEAHTMGFEIIKPFNPEVVSKGKARSPLAEKVGEGELRTIDTLSLDTDNTLRFLVFGGSSPEVNWQAVPPDFQHKWKQARDIIEADNRGSWGANFLAHSEEVKNIFPDIETAQGFYETKFKDILRLVKWADKKIHDVGQDKQIKILAFGHEDYLAHVLQEEFNAEGIKNCETLAFNVVSGQQSKDEVSKIDSHITATFRDEERELH